MPNLKLTKRTIEEIPFTTGEQKHYRDNELTGFGLRVGQSTKTFFVEGQLNRRTKRISVGRYPLVTPEQARKKALNYLSKMADGCSPVEKRLERMEVTVADSFKTFFEAKQGLAAVTVRGYRRSSEIYLIAWAKKPIASISRQMVRDEHSRISKAHGGVTANNVLRHFRSVYNFTSAVHDNLPPNPCAILTLTRSWAQQRRRQTLIGLQQLPSWWHSVHQQPHYARDYLLIALFTGMRRSEIAQLRWEYINLETRQINLPKTKNGDPLSLPLSEFLTNIFLVRQAFAETGNPWVFPSVGKTGHLVETKSFVRRVVQLSGVSFTLHDLRRTFITIAESLDIPAYALRKLLNHRSGGDVTGGYIVIDAERLRQPVDRIEKKILQLVNGT